MFFIYLAICDDERTELEYLTKLVARWSAARGIASRVKTFPSAEAFLFSYAEDKGYDVLLLDIQMENVDGIELAKRVRADNEAVQIIFVTGYPDYISEGYEVSALHYLIKPVEESKLFGVLDRAYKNLSRQERFVLFDSGGESIRTAVSDIVYAEAFSHTVVVKTASGSIEVKKTVGEVEKLLGDGFVRCHRSYIAGLKHISRITKTDVLLDNGASVPLSRRLYNEVNRAFINYYKGEVQ